MTKLSLGWFEMPAATLGPESPLPPLMAFTTASALATHFDNSISPPDRKYFGYGGYLHILPYTMQDVYDRTRKPRSFRVAILENDFLKAIFLLELGGRLWSLYHKPTQRELLDVNPVFQPANLALRNAWFSGGVEWNAAIIGHSPLTCSPIFAARLSDDDGSPVLRFYEWDRVACIPIQIDFLLPSQLSFLLVRVRLVNPHDREIPMYWWSNIAVPEQEATRVLVPADSVIRHTYDGKWRSGFLPVDGSFDITYPTHHRNCTDSYFRIPEDHRPWVAALDAEGRGLIHASTARLKGRKLFVWGMIAGGRHWQEFLSVPGKAYLEIQGGLARTQYEYLPMPAGAQWSWLEAYGLMEANPALVHGTAWTAAWSEVDRRLTKTLPQEWLEAEHMRTEYLSFQPPKEILHRGSGWGALEQRRRVKVGESPFCGPALVFDDLSLGPAQQPWLNLLDEGQFPCPSPETPPMSWMVQPEWRELLEKSMRHQVGRHWNAYLHLGLMQYAAGDITAARRSWEQSVKWKPSVWALRNLACLAHIEQNLSKAAELWKQALVLQPTMYSLAVETLQELLAVGQANEVRDVLMKLPESVRTQGRLRFIEAQAALTLGDLERVEQILRDLEIPDTRECETSPSDLWFELQATRLAAKENRPVDDALKRRVRSECSPPTHLDFRGAVHDGEW